MPLPFPAPELARREVLSLFLAAPLAACGSRQSQDNASIRINTGGLIGEAGLFLAQDNGYFREEGVSVEFITAAANASTDSLAQLATGDLDLAVFGPTAAMFNAIDRGFDVIGIMPLNTLSAGDNSRGLVVRQDLIDNGRYRSPTDLRGMKVGTLTTGGVGHFFLLEALARGNVRPDEIQLSTLPMPDSLVALSSGSLDAAFLVEPFISALKERHTGRLMLSAAETSIGVPTAVVFASTIFAERYPDHLAGFTVALLRGQRDYATAVSTGQGRDRLFRSLQKHTATKDMARLEAMALPHVDPNGGYDAAGLKRLQQFFLSSNILRRELPPKLVFDSSHVERARIVLAARTNSAATKSGSSG